MRVSATGGAAVAVTTLGPQQRATAGRTFLPDGRRFLFYAHGAPDTAGIYLGALDGSAPTRLTPADSAGRVSARPGGCCGCGRARSWPSGWIWRRRRSRASR